MSDLYRLVYSSRNLLDASEGEMQAEIAQILQASQANNDKVGVTGALMFNAGAFAQVLEGPRRGVEATFERIQRDVRHADVTVLQCGPAESRGFANWSMAFVGQSDRGKAVWNNLASQTGFDLSRIGGDQVFTMLRDLLLDDEGVPASLANAEPEKPAYTATPSINAEVVRAEIELLRPDRTAKPSSAPTSSLASAAMGRTSGNSATADRSSPPPTGTVALAVMQAALTEERQRTTDLRNQVDELRTALAETISEASSIRADRDRWVQRARALATMIADEANEQASGMGKGGAQVRDAA
jgi:hypothetical protein